MDEYVNRQKFRKRLRSWLSAPKNNWLDSATDGRRSTREYSYDTEPLDVLLRLNGLQETWQASLSSSHSSSNMSIAGTDFKTEGNIADPMSETHARRKRIVAFYRKLKGTFHRPSPQASRDISPDGEKEEDSDHWPTPRESWHQEFTLPDIDNTQPVTSVPHDFSLARTTPFMARDFFVATAAPSTNILDLLAGGKP